MKKDGWFAYIASIGPAPCDACKWRSKCATGYACAVFDRWQRTGEMKEELGRAPSRAIYLKLWPDEAVERQPTILTVRPMAEIGAVA